MITSIFEPSLIVLLTKNNDFPQVCLLLVNFLRPRQLVIPKVNIRYTKGINEEAINELDKQLEALKHEHQSLKEDTGDFEALNDESTKVLSDIKGKYILVCFYLILGNYKLGLEIGFYFRFIESSNFK